MSNNMVLKRKCIDLQEIIHRVTAERDELHRKLDHKEQQRESELRNGQAGDRLVGELQQRMTAADQEIDDLRAELKAARLGACKMIIGDELP